MCRVACLTAVIVRTADFHHLHARIDQFDHRFEARVIERIGQQPFRRIVGGHQQQNSPFEQCLEQPRDEHGIADVMHMKLVETQHPTILQQFVEGHFEGIVLLAMAEHALMQLREKLMEMQAPFLGDRQGLKKAIEQPALAASDGAEQIETRRGSVAGAKQQTGLLRHAINDALLAVAEGVTLTAGLVPEVIADRLGAGVMPGAGRQTLAQPTAQRRPALDQSRSFRRLGRHCGRLRVRQNRLPRARRHSVTRRWAGQPPQWIDSGR